jgi:hypothetical protein
VPPPPTSVLVIGAHREELPFGEQVAAGLTDEPIEILRIPEGISGRHPRQDEVFRYRVCHQELYLQLRQQLKGRYRLLIDLHAGQDPNGPMADLMCHDQSLLGCVRQRFSAPEVAPACRQRVRLIPLVAADGSGLAADAGGPSRPLGRALIPRSVWAMQEPVYAAVEVFLREPGGGRPDDWDLARELVRHILNCCP